MDSYFGYRFLLLFTLVVLNAFFAASEVALLSVRRSRLKEMADEGNVGAIAALSLLDNTERLLSVVQVGVTLASLGIGWAGEESIFAIYIAIVDPLLTPATEFIIRTLGLLFTFFLMTLVTVVIGEVVPKNVAIENSARFATLVAPVLLIFYKLVVPFVWLIETSSAWLSRLLGVASDGGAAGHSIEELKFITTSGRNSGQFGQLEESIIHRTLDLQDLSVREVMVPWNDVVSLPVTATLSDVLARVVTTSFSRLPVYEDDPRNVLGILHAKDLIRVWSRRRTANRDKKPPSRFHLRHMLRRHLVVPESKPVNEMLEQFLEGRQHMAMVVDEFGLIVGLVTLEDIIEQTVGEIQDEHDIRKERPKLEAPSFIVEGTIPIRDLELQYGISLPTGAGFETLAGFLLEEFGDIPEKGESTEFDQRRYTVVEMVRNRIGKVSIERIPLPAVEGEGAEVEEEEA